MVTRPLRQAVQTVLEIHQAPPGEVNVLIADDEELKRLNQTFRRIDEPTDVLTFPAPPQTPGQIGDIALSLDFARKQAKIRGVRVIDEAAMLAVHGALHLLGYDDQTESDRRTMLAKMNEAMAAAGLPTEPEWASLPHGEKP